MISRIGYKEILRNKPLLDEYAKACLVDVYEPQEQIYEALDKAGLLYCFAANVQGELVGFASLVVSIAPHNGKKIGSVESLFCLPSFRKFGAGLYLIEACRNRAKEEGCQIFTATARVGSELEKILEHSKHFEKTHSQFTEFL